MNLHTCACHSAIALALLSAVVVLPSCSGPGDERQLEDSPAILAPSAVFEGTWSVGGVSGLPGTVMLYGSAFRVAEVPCAAILQQLYPGSSVADATGGSEDIPFGVTSTSATSQLYSLMPTAWRLSGAVDGVRRSVSLAISPTAGGTGDVSWGTYSKSGVLTLVLHATSFTADGGEPVAVSLKLVFTATRRK